MSSINEIMSSRLGQLIRNSVNETARTDELVFDDVIIYRNCISCSRKCLEKETQNKKCEICIWKELKERIVLNDDVNMNLAERVDYFNSECEELGIIMTRRIFVHLKNFYRIDGNHVRFNLKNKKMMVHEGCENKPYDVYAKKMKL